MSMIIYSMIAALCLIVWLQDRKIKSLGELVDVHDDVLDDLRCDAERMDKEIETEVSNRKEHMDKISWCLCAQESIINTIKQDICGLKTGHDMEIIAAQPINCLGYNTGYLTVRRQCKTCKAVVQTNERYGLSPEDRNVLKYKFNIDVPAAKQDEGNAASKKRKSK